MPRSLEGKGVSFLEIPVILKPPGTVTHQRNGEGGPIQTFAYLERKSNFQKVGKILIQLISNAKPFWGGQISLNRRFCLVKKGKVETSLFKLVV